MDEKDGVKDNKVPIGVHNRLNKNRLRVECGREKKGGLKWGKYERGEKGEKDRDLRLDRSM